MAVEFDEWWQEKVMQTDHRVTKLEEAMVAAVRASKSQQKALEVMEKVIEQLVVELKVARGEMVSRLPPQ
jgi:predicted transcriptional regulator